MDLSTILSLDNDSKIRELTVHVERNYKLDNMQGLKSVGDMVLSADIPVSVSRVILTLIANGLKNLKSEECKNVGEYLLHALAPRLNSFEEVDAAVRDELVEVYCDVDGDFVKAAKTLTQKSPGVFKTDAEKFGHFVTIAQLYIRVDSTADAETFINRAQTFRYECKDSHMQIRFKTAYAHILDSNRRFLEASMRYYEILQEGGEGLKESEVILILEKALICAVLGPAGLQRSRILGNLFKDERMGRLEHFNVLEKMYKGTLLKKSEIASFEKTLQPHQLALLSDGTTVLDRAVTEHNMLAASKVYQNINFEELGKLLEISPKKAEAVAARMISEKRLLGLIDQCESFLDFNVDTEGSMLVAWDKSISSLCMSLNNVLDSVNKCRD